MDHVVYLDAKANELEKILDGNKKMIVRGAMGRKLPYGRVEIGDALYFLNNNAEGVVKAVAKVCTVFNSNKLSQGDSVMLLKNHQNQLNLTDVQFKKWSSKRYIVLIEFEEVKSVEPFAIDKSDFGNMDDWLLVQDINNVKK